MSSLVSTLAESYGYCVDRDLHSLMGQALELSIPVEDWEEAATQAGATKPRTHWFYKGREYDSAQEVCEENDIEPYVREVYENWVVTDWLADKLINYGEKVQKDFAGLCVWARTTSGQMISMDVVIQKIYEDLMKS